MMHREKYDLTFVGFLPKLYDLNLIRRKCQTTQIEGESAKSLACNLQNGQGYERFVIERQTHKSQNNMKDKEKLYQAERD